MITADREAASITRLEISTIRKEVTILNECTNENTTAIDERFKVLEADSRQKELTLAEFTKSVTD